MPRQILILAIVLPIAALIGYLLADPTQIQSMAGIGLVLALLISPLLLKWHHPVLVFAWNASLIVIFLPGQPHLWMFMGVLSLGLTVLQRFLDANFRLINVSSVTWTLLIIGLVVYITAKVTGGVGIRSLGGGVYGGRKYILIWFAIIAYFALSSQKIPSSRAFWASVAFFGSSITAALSTVAYLLGPAAWFLYSIFPADHALHLAAKDFGAASVDAVSRYSGFSVAGIGLVPIFLIRYGIRGLLDWHRPWRISLLMLVIAFSLLGGFRSTFVYFALLFSVQFLVEGLHKTRILPVAIGVVVLGFAVLVGAATKLPMPIQRSLSVIPFIPVKEAAKADSEISSNWRKEIWKRVTPEVWEHFWLGKGLTSSARNYYLETQAYRYGLADEYEMTILAGDYHNGPLTLIIPFGIWGVLAFIAFLLASLRVMWRNRQAGTGWLPNINRVILSVFITKIIFFFGVFGSFATDFFGFVGLIGLSVSLNGNFVRSTSPVSVPSNPSDTVTGAVDQPAGALELNR